MCRRRSRHRQQVIQSISTLLGLRYWYSLFVVFITCKHYEVVNYLFISEAICLKNNFSHCFTYLFLFNGLADLVVARLVEQSCRSLQFAHLEWKHVELQCGVEQNKWSVWRCTDCSASRENHENIFSMRRFLTAEAAAAMIKPCWHERCWYNITTSLNEVVRFLVLFLELFQLMFWNQRQLFAPAVSSQTPTRFNWSRD